MASRHNLHRIGILDRSQAGWTAGRVYTRVLTYSLANACEGNGVELFLLLDTKTADVDKKESPVNVIPLPAPRYFRGEQRLRTFLALPRKSVVKSVAETLEISVLLPLSHIPTGFHMSKTIGWIPDFQHVYLPEMFSETECRGREINYRLTAQRATLVMLSSRNALQHFAAFVPQYAGKGRLASFPSIFAFELPKGDIVSTLHKFNLPNRFALVVNQFWRHKNHLVVVNAISQLRRNSIRIPVVMVGLPADYRDPLNQTLSSLLQAIACCDVNDRIKVLGLVNHEDLVNLMRAAAVIIQPSRFEGWSTVVQDSKALGRPLICSDIPVHREQAPNALGFFNWSDAQELADLLAASWPNLGPGPEPPIEERSLGNERAFARHFGQELLQICREAAST